MAPLGWAAALASAITVAFAVPSSALPAAREQSKFIVGGVPAAPGDFPYIVSLVESASNDHACAGSLLNKNTVLTAGHCSLGIGDLEEVNVRLGSLQMVGGGFHVGVKKIIVHPEYVDGVWDYDFAIWKLAEPVPEGNGISYASLPSNISHPIDGSYATVAGWGQLSPVTGEAPTELMKVTVPIANHDKCKALYGEDMNGGDRITESMFCAGFDEGGKDACYGDSGGPIRDDATGAVIGVVSWGEGCAEAEYPGVYANVGVVLDFIRRNMKC